MAKILGNLTALVNANPKPLKSGLARAKKMIRNFTSDVGAIGGTLFNGFTAAAGAVGLGLTVAHLKEVAEQIDSTAKTADRLGITTQALIGLRFGADLAGVGVEAFDGSLTTMVKNVGLAAMGTGKARDALDQLGFNFQALAKVSPENQFKAIAQALSRVEDPTARTALAIKIFGDAGADMINVIKDGVPAIEAMQARAEELGLTFDRVSAAKVEAANDALAEVNRVIGTIGQTVVIELAPYVTAVAQGFTEWATTGRSFGEITTRSIEVVTKGVAYLVDGLKWAKLAWNALKVGGVVAIKLLATPLDGLTRVIIRLVELTSDYLPQSVVDGAAQVKAALDGFAAGLDEIQDDALQTMDEIWDAPSTVDKVDAYFKGIRDRAEEAAKSVAESAAKVTEPFTQDLYARVRGPNTKPEEPKQQKKSDYSSVQTRAIEVGSAEAIGFRGLSAVDAANRFYQRLQELEKKQLDELKRIREGLEEDNDVIVTG